jgi:hypothetical protein
MAEQTTRRDRLRYRLARWLVNGRSSKCAEKDCRHDILERLALNATGPIVHVNYYRQDCADALAEIARLRRLAYSLAIGQRESCRAE